MPMLTSSARPTAAFYTRVRARARVGQTPAECPAVQRVQLNVAQNIAQAYVNLRPELWQQKVCDKCSATQESESTLDPSQALNALTRRQNGRVARQRVVYQTRNCTVFGTSHVPNELRAAGACTTAACISCSLRHPAHRTHRRGTSANDL